MCLALNLPNLAKLNIERNKHATAGCSSIGRLPKLTMLRVGIIRVYPDALGIAAWTKRVLSNQLKRNLLPV